MNAYKLNHRVEVNVHVTRVYEDSKTVLTFLWQRREHQTVPKWYLQRLLTLQIVHTWQCIQQQNIPKFVMFLRSNQHLSYDNTLENMPKILCSFNYLSWVINTFKLLYIFVEFLCSTYTTFDSMKKISFRIKAQSMRLALICINLQTDIKCQVISLRQSANFYLKDNSK